MAHALLHLVSTLFRLDVGLRLIKSHDVRFVNASIPICHLSILQCFMHLQNIIQSLSSNPFSPLSGQALDLLVLLSSMHCCTSTRSLSTSSSSRGLTLSMGYLILRGASRLDAFSVYPCRTWLPCSGFGNPTGTPAVRPSRSSRTKDSSSQISYAHAG